MNDKGGLAAQGGLKLSLRQSFWKECGPNNPSRMRGEEKHTFRESERSVKRKHLVELEAPLDQVGWPGVESTTPSVSQWP